MSQCLFNLRQLLYKCYNLKLSIKIFVGFCFLMALTLMYFDRPVENVEVFWADLIKPRNQSDGFQAVGDQFNTYLYSAYFDNRSQPHIIHVTALLQYRRLSTVNLFACIMWNGKNGILLRAEFEVTEDWRRPTYEPGIIKCNLQGQSIYYNEFSVIPYQELKGNETKNILPLNLLNVKYPTQYVRNFTRCVPAIYNFHQKEVLVQMIETDLLFGTEHFIMYYLDHSPALEVLKTYIDQGIIELLPWNLPISFAEDSVHYFGQFLHIHECIYRNLHVSRYVFMADIDEVIVSQKFSSWTEITEQFFKPNCVSLSFKNSYFLLQVPNTTAIDFPMKKLALENHLTYFYKTFHSTFIDHRDRSKILLDPRGVWIAKIHFVEIAMPGYVPCFVSEADAYLHHSRQRNEPVIGEDPVMISLADKLVPRILNVLFRSKQNGSVV